MVVVLINVPKLGGPLSTPTLFSIIGYNITKPPDQAPSRTNQAQPSHRSASHRSASYKPNQAHPHPQGIRVLIQPGPGQPGTPAPAPASIPIPGPSHTRPGPGTCEPGQNIINNTITTGVTA